MVTATTELPPRTRRIHPIDNKIILLRGTTSAYAENTTVMAARIQAVRNYLRVRGEYHPHHLTNPTPR